jgi:hypothetical protein
MAVGLGNLDQLLDLVGGQVLAGARPGLSPLKCCKSVAEAARFIIDRGVLAEGGPSSLSFFCRP